MHRCRSDILEFIPADQAQLVEWLAVPHQSAYAIRKLKQLGSRAVPSLRRPTASRTFGPSRLLDSAGPCL